MCPVPLNPAREFVALGSRLWKVPKIRMPSRGATKRTCANSVGSGTKRGRVSSGAPFYN